MLNLGGGLAQLANVTTAGLNIYYDPSRPENAYLLGATHEIGVNFLMPIPEPAVSGLFLLGVALMRGRRGGARRRRLNVPSTN